MRVPAFGWQVALAFVLSLLVLEGTIVWLDNVHIATTNGMYKSIQVRAWIADPFTAQLDASNYLYLPLYGLLCRLLDGLGIWRGVAWKQLAVVNAFWASVCVAFVYAFFHRLTGSARVSALAACFHLGSGFVLLLAVISEDIMPGYALVFGAMALAALWFDRPTVRRVIAVAALFTFGWLIEWRLIFPTLPALVLALLMAPETLRRRLKMVGVLLVSIVAVAGLVQLFWGGHNGAAALHDILWTGKGVATGWAGFTWEKAWMMLAGVSNYFLITSFDMESTVARRLAVGLSVVVILEIVILIATVVVLWPRRSDPRLRAIAAVFLGTAGAGEIFNLYSQPQDPQMQVNVMPWLTVAWGLLAATLSLRDRRGWLAAFAALSIVPFAWNLAMLSRERGTDGRWVGALAAIERNFSTDNTVFLYWGFEAIATWQYALWSQTREWDQAGPVPPAPSVDPKFKWIAVTSGAVHHTQWTADEHATVLKRDIEMAFDRGYRVAASYFWDWSAVELGYRLGGLSAANRAGAIHAMLHESYVAVLVFTDERIGPYYELKRRSASR